VWSKIYEKKTNKNEKKEQKENICGECVTFNHFEFPHAYSFSLNAAFSKKKIKFVH